jgi:hypothetical protein
MVAKCIAQKIYIKLFVLTIGYRQAICSIRTYFFTNYNWRYFQEYFLLGRVAVGPSMVENDSTGLACNM